MKLLFLAGSSRKWSWNKMLARNAYDMAKAAKVDATFIDLTDFPMPIYNGDDEEAHGLPEKAKELKSCSLSMMGFSLPRLNTIALSPHYLRIPWIGYRVLKKVMMVS